MAQQCFDAPIDVIADDVPRPGIDPGFQQHKIVDVVGVLVLAFLGVYTWYGWLLTLQAQGNTSPMLVLPKPIWYAAVPVSGLVMIGYTVARIWKTIGVSSGKRETRVAR